MEHGRDGDVISERDHSCVFGGIKKVYTVQYSTVYRLYGLNWGRDYLVLVGGVEGVKRTYTESHLQEF